MNQTGKGLPMETWRMILLAITLQFVVPLSVLAVAAMCWRDESELSRTNLERIKRDQCPKT